jgi:non-heme chloroperoxidase
LIRLEVLQRLPRGASSRPPLLFVHGAYVGAWCWDEHFLAWFAARGFPSYALSLRGHGRSGGRENLHDFGLADYAEDLAQAVAELPQPPVLVGHSMGAAVVEKYLERASARAAILACPVPPFGLLPSTFALALTRPRLFGEINALAAGRGASRSALAEALFADPVSADRIERYCARFQAESRRALLDLSGWALPRLWNSHRPETLVLGAEHDALISPALAAAGANLLGARYRLLEGLGHAVMLETRWEVAAEAIYAWLGRLAADSARASAARTSPGRR